MNDNLNSAFMDDLKFQSLMIDCMDSLQRGESIDRTALRQKFPKYAEDLDRYLDVLNVLDQFAGGLQQLGSSAEVVSPYGATITPSSTNSDFESGDTIRYIGEYEVLEEIARGGMGIVFKARQQTLKRIVALKMILSGRLADGAEIDRFRREAQAASRLKHPNIVAVHEIGEHEGRHYFTMDFIPGRSLAEEIRDESLAPRRAAELVKTVAEAVQFAHRAGTLHRDLKPANILLTSDDVPHVTDFGLAKILDDVDDESRAELTASGQILGTPSYMSPEQAAGKQNLVGPSSDVYSLGAILYACLTGRAPFVADSPVDTLMQVMHKEPVSPRQLNPAVPQDLETICLKCLNKESHTRYETALELAEDLQRFVEGHPVMARPIGRVARVGRWTKRNPVVATLMLLVGFLLIAGTTASSILAIAEHSQRVIAEKAESGAIAASKVAEAERDAAKQARKDAEQARSDAEKDKNTAIKAQREEAFQRARAESEKKRAQWQSYVARLQPMRQAWLEQEFGQLDRLLQESIPADEEPDFRGWEWYYFQDQVKQASKRIGDHRNFTGHLAYDPVHDRVLASTGKDTWELWDLKTNQCVATLKLSRCHPETVQFSPNGKKIAWGTYECRLRIQEIATKQILHEIDVSPEENHAGNLMGDLVWSPSGDQIASVTRAGGVKVWSASTGGLIKQLQFPRTVKFQPHCIDWHETGGIAIGLRFGVLNVWDSSLSQLRWTTTVEDDQFEWPSVVQWNPAGNRLLYAGKETVIYDEDGNKLKTFPIVGGATRACWLDNDRLAISGSSQDIQIYEVSDIEEINSYHVHGGRVEGLAFSQHKTLLTGGLDGTVRSVSTERKPTVAQKIVAHTQGTFTGLSWAPHGEQVATAGLSDKNPKIWDAFTGELDFQLEGHEFNPIHVSWSHDGQHLISTDRENVLLWNPQAQELINRIYIPSNRREEAFGWSVSWHPNDKEIAISSCRLIVLNASTLEKSLQMFSKRHGEGFWPAYSPDGNRLGVFSDGNIFIVDSQTGKQIHSGRKNLKETGGRGVSWSPGGRFFALGRDQIQIYETKSYREVGVLTGHRGEVRDVQFAPNGSRIASIGGANNLILWDAASGTLLLRLPVPDEHRLEKMQWSPDGRRIALTSSSGNLWIWGSPQMPEMPRETDFLEDGILNSVKTYEPKLTE